MAHDECWSLKIGFDMDGTVTKYPEFFSLLSRLTRENNSKVYIISSRSNNRDVVEKTRKELRSLHIAFDEIYLLSDPGINGKGQIPENLDWYQKYIYEKVAFCKKEGIRLFFDDEENVIDLFRTYAPEILVWKT